MAAFPGLRGSVLIIIQAVLLPGTCLITYFMSTSSGHVEEKFPYISDTGTYAPESGVFGVLLTLYSISAFISVYCRWKMLSNHYTGTKTVPFLNNFALILGAFGAVGTLMVACFQETSQLAVHMVGAFMAFALVCGYMWLQAALTRSVVTLPGRTQLLFILRLAVAAATTLSFIGTAALSVVAESEKPGNHSRTSEPGTGKWHSWMKGYDLHVAAASFEWAMAGWVSLYFLTFFSEFWYVTIGMPAISVVPSNKE